MPSVSQDSEYLRPLVTALRLSSSSLGILAVWIAWCNWEAMSHLSGRKDPRCSLASSATPPSSGRVRLSHPAPDVLPEGQSRQQQQFANRPKPEALQWHKPYPCEPPSSVASDCAMPCVVGGTVNALHAIGPVFGEHLGGLFMDGSSHHVLANHQLRIGMLAVPPAVNSKCGVIW